MSIPRARCAPYAYSGVVAIHIISFGGLRLLVAAIVFMPRLIRPTALLEKMNEFGLGRGKLSTIANGAAILDPDLRNNMNIEQLEDVMAVVAN